MAKKPMLSPRSPRRLAANFAASIPERAWSVYPASPAIAPAPTNLQETQSVYSCALVLSSLSLLVEAIVKSSLRQ
ncbi:hypothetical protein GGI08_005090 [Coemansia sp. S2]|nr:hypothetical protein GGI08_005090 [Coemansia sp. S2]